MATGTTAKYKQNLHSHWNGSPEQAKLIEHRDESIACDGCQLLPDPAVAPQAPCILIVLSLVLPAHTEWDTKNRPPTCQLIMSSKTNVHLK